MTYRQAIAFTDIPPLPAGTNITAAAVPMNVGGSDYIATPAQLVKAAEKTVDSLPSNTSYALTDLVPRFSTSVGDVVQSNMDQLITYVMAQIIARGGTGGGTSPATTYTVTTSASSVTVGSPVTVTVTPGAGGWQSGVSVTLTQSGLTGSADANSKTGSGTTPVTFTYTPSAAGSGTLSATAPNMTLSGNAAPLTVTTAATAPGAVGSLSAGTPTSTAIPLTWTTPSGTAPITYAVTQAAHGSSTYTTAAGTFSATGGTVTGLTASTNYDFKVVATNSVGSGPAASLLTGITTAAAAPPGVGSPLTMTSPTYVARADGSGRQMLSVGKGSTTVALPTDGNWVIFAKIKGGTSSGGADTAVLTITDANSQFLSAMVNYTGNLYVLDRLGSAGSGASYIDGAFHEIALASIGTGQTATYLDGVQTASRGFNAGNGFPGNVTLTVTAPNIGAVVAIFDVRLYTGSAASPGTLLGHWLLDGSGASS